MNIKSLSVVVVLMSFILSVAVLDLGCKKDDSPTTPSGPGVSYGSGTITATSSAGPLSITGTGAWPIQAGPSVLAVYDTSLGSGIFFVYGYQRTSGSHYNIVALGAMMPTRVDTGTYNHPQAFFAAGYNVDTTFHADSLVYQTVSGSITVTSVNGSSALGMYSVMARKGTAPPIQFTGTFNVTYAVGVMPDY
jgi:hypothetical protein